MLKGLRKQHTKSSKIKLEYQQKNLNNSAVDALLLVKLNKKKQVESRLPHLQKGSANDELMKLIQQNKSNAGNQSQLSRLEKMN